MTRGARGALVLVLALLVGFGCGGDDSNRPVRTLIAFTQTGLTGRRGEVWIARVDGTARRRLVRGVWPAVSPDGRWIAFHRCGEFHCDLYLVPASGGTARPLARRADSPQWAPTSDRIVASRSVTSRETALVSVDAEGSREVELVRGVFYGWSISPSGDEVVYARAGASSPERFTGAHIDLFVIGIEGGEPRRLTDDGRSGFPVWGPDTIAFARLLPYRGWGRHEIWRIEPDGEGRRPVTGRLPKRLLGSGITGLIPVAWSSDGRALVASWANEFGGPPYAVDPQTGAIRKIGDFGFSAIPAFTP